MAVNQMQAIQSDPRQPTKLDTVAQAVDIASKVLGTGIEVYNAPLKRRMMQGQEEQTNLENSTFPMRKEVLENQVSEGKPATPEVIQSLYDSFDKEDQPHIDIKTFSNLTNQQAKDIIAANASKNPELKREAAKHLSDKRLQIKMGTSDTKTKHYDTPADFAEYGLGTRWKSDGYNDDLAESRDERLKRLNANDIANFKERRLDKFVNDATVKKATEMRESASQILDLTDMSTSNPIAAAAIPTFMARASGEVGNLSEADKRPFGGSRAFLARFQQAYEQATKGTLTPENAAFVRELAMKMRDVAERKRYTRAVELSRSGGKVRPEVSEPELMDLFVTEAGVVAPAEETRMINGSKYKKVEGGWVPAQ